MQQVKIQKSPDKQGVFKKALFVAAISAGVFFLLFAIFPKLGNPFANLRNLGKSDQPNLMQQLKTSDEYRKMFGDNLEGIAKLDTDLNGVPDVDDQDDDGDGIPDIYDDDDDNDGLKDNEDPTTAAIGLLVAQSQNPYGNGFTQGSENNQDDNQQTDETQPPVPGPAGPQGEKGEQGAQGVQGQTGTVGKVTDDGVVKTTLTGSDLNVQLLLASGSGLTKTSSGLSLMTTCFGGELLKWSGTAWECGSDDGGISYTAGAGITISAGVIESVLGSSIDTSEISNGTILFADLGQNSCGSSQIIKWNGSAWVCAADNDIDTDDQTLSFNNGTSVLSIAGGNTADLTSLLDNTDELASLSCSNSQIARYNGSAWICSNDIDTDTDDQDLTVIGSGVGRQLSITDGNTVNIPDTDTDTNTTYSAGTGLGLSATTFSLTDSGATAGSYGSATEIPTFTIDSKGRITSITTATITDDDTLAALSCGNNQVAKYNGSAWVCANDVDTDTNTDQQTLSLSVNTLSISGGNSVDLSGYLDNTDSQNISFNDGTQVLSIGGGNTADLSSLLDNTDLLASLSCGNNQVAKYNGSAWICANDVDTDTDTDDQNLTVIGSGLSRQLEIDDGNTVNIPDADTDTTYSAGTGLSLGGTTFSLADSGATAGTYGSATEVPTFTIDAKGRITSITTATITDDDTLAALSCGTNQIAKWNGSAWTCASDVDTDTNTDQQTLSLSVNTLSIAGGNSVDLSGYLDNTDAQNLSYVAGTQVLSIAGGNNVSLSSLLDNTDSQDLSLSSNTLSLTGDGTTVSLASYLDNTDLLALLSCGTNQIAKWNGSAWVCANDVDTDTQDISLGGNTLSLVDGGTVDLSGYLDDTDTDTQDLSLLSNTLSLVAGGSVDLSGYLDNTDSQNLSYVAGTQVLSIGGGNNVSLSSLLDNTDNQDLSLSSNVLSLTNDGTTVSLASYLDNTDSQNLFFTIDAPNGTDPAADSVTDTLALADGSGITITGNSTTDTITIAAVLGTTIDGSEIVDGTISADDLGTDSVTGVKILNGEVSLAKLAADSVDSSKIANGSVANGDLVNSAVTVVAGSGLTTGGSASLGGSTTVNVGAGNGITVNSDDITVRALASADGLSSTTSSGSGIEVLSTGIGLLQGCSNGQLLKWNESTDVWACGDDDLGTIAADSLNFTDLSDSLSLDATTSIAAGANNFNINLDGTGDFSIQDNGTSVFSVLDNGTAQFRNSTDSSSAFLVEDSAGLDIFDVDTVANAVRIGELVDDAADVLLVLDGVSGTDPTGIAGGIYYNTTDNRFRCYQNSAWYDCIPAAYSEYSFISGLETWTNMPAAETQFLNTPIRIQVDLTRAREFRFGISRMAGAVTAGADCRLQYATTQGGTYANLDGSAGPEVDISGTAELKSSAWSTIVAGAKSDVYIRVMCKQGNGTDDPQFRGAYIQVR